MARKSQSTLAINAKVSSINLQAIPTDGSVAFPEGYPVARDTTTYKAVQPTGGDTYQAVYISFVDSTRSDVEFQQGDPGDTSAPTRSIQSGGLSCLMGAGIEVGMPAAAWHGGALPTVGQQVYIDGTSKRFRGQTAAATMNHGIVTRIEQGYAYFLFHSVPRNGA
jgi:hypothetical protein